MKIADEIRDLKKEKDVFILAHNYQLPEIQDAADFVGDSLGLARKAAGLDQKTVIMCGVYFMAETAALLNPGKIVLIPDTFAGCPLANFASPKMVLEWRKQYPDHAFVAYVNTSAEVKALVDICCTSSNAVKVVSSIKNDKIVFLPDKNLGAYVQGQVKDKSIVLWPGFCVVHEKADLEAVLKTKEAKPDSLVIAHPECPGEILELADGVCSTGQMFDFVASHPSTRDFIVVTEWGITHALKKRFPGRNFIEPAGRRSAGKRMECRNMKRITPAKLLHSLKKEEFRVSVRPEIAGAARKSIEKMLLID